MRRRQSIHIKIFTVGGFLAVKIFAVPRCYTDFVVRRIFLGMTWFLWGSPFLVLGGVLIAVVSSRKKAAVSEPLTSEEQARLDELLRAAPEGDQIKGSEKK